MSEELLVEPLLIFFGMLFTGTFCATLFRYLRIPYTVGLLMLGIFMGFCAQVFPFLSPLNSVHLSPGLIMYVILPTLIFEASLNIDARALSKNLGPIMLLAVFGVLVSCVLIAGVLNWLSILPLGTALIFGALISATDPVAVIALFRELKASERLTLLMDGESLFNDATAIVLFSVLLGMGSSISGLQSADIWSALLRFCLAFFGGVLFGGAMGIIMTALLRFSRKDRFVQRSQMIVLAYFTFIVADHYLHISGVMAVLTAGLIVSLNLHRVMSERNRGNLHTFWEYAAFVANSFIFLMMGMTQNHMFWDMARLQQIFPVLAITVLVVLAARAVIVYGLVPVSNRLKLAAPISKGMQTVMFWGGLRGAVPISLMMALPESVPGRELIIQMVLFIILITLLIQGTTTGLLLQHFRLSGVEKRGQVHLSGEK